MHFIINCLSGHCSLLWLAGWRCAHSCYSNNSILRIIKGCFFIILPWQSEVFLSGNSQYWSLILPSGWTASPGEGGPGQGGHVGAARPAAVWREVDVRGVCGGDRKLRGGHESARGSSRLEPGERRGGRGVEPGSGQTAGRVEKGKNRRFTSLLQKKPHCWLSFTEPGRCCFIKYFHKLIIHALNLLWVPQVNNSNTQMTEVITNYQQQFSVSSNLSLCGFESFCGHISVSVFSDRFTRRGVKSSHLRVIVNTSNVNL